MRVKNVTSSGYGNFILKYWTYQKMLLTSQEDKFQIYKTEWNLRYPVKAVNNALGVTRVSETVTFPSDYWFQDPVSEYRMEVPVVVVHSITHTQFVKCSCLLDKLM